ncbi:MAG: quinolinate synthase NadA, partial [Candidatus Thiodiazotropha sp. (ex Cardiolucina cf. quadrata)]|nr:quinolinate synthase NadA [Candidatus Thiodiazotropha sp. (ex Cardiolucina cf. quadrata)]
MSVQTLNLPNIIIPEHPQWPVLSDQEKRHIKGRIAKKLKDQNAVLVAHYYTDPDLQALAEESGGC